MTAYSEGFLEHIVNVNFASGLYLGIYADATTGNNANIPSGTGLITFAGLAFDLFVGADGANILLTPKLLQKNELHQYYEDRNAEWSFANRGMHFVNLNALPSSFGPNVALPGTITMTYTNPSGGGGVVAVVGLYEFKALKNKRSNLAIPGQAGLTVPGALVSVRTTNDPGPPPTADLTFTVNRATKALVKTGP